GAVIERPIVDVHADETVRQGFVHVASVLERVSQRVVAVIESVADALLEKAADLADGVRAQIATDGVSSQRQRQAGLFHPPDAEIDDEAETLVLKGQLPLVDNET